MKLAHGDAAEFGPSHFFDGGTQSVETIRRFETRQGNVRTEFARFPSDAERFELRFDGSSQIAQMLID
jgi:hypothetical protein